MAPSQLKGLIIRRGHRIVFVRRTWRTVDKKRKLKKRRRPQPHRHLV
jgi:hypothetical protein